MRRVARKRADFDRLARQHGADLYRFAVWLCRDETLARDLVQETFLRAWRAVDSLKDEAAAKSWLITILRREYARTFERKVPPLVSIDALVIEDRDAATPQERVERQQLRQRILALPANYREPLVMQVVIGMSCEEIATELEISRSAVMTRLFRARGLLADRLEEDGEGNGSI
ncbi:sigma-70 family RNA polymerase sigma factor [Marinihelvus fidelis]|uniref:Sigma-70 family RNA polymerase sigma factor n=2 Tax=Marinihelvus fidelis TaxID=2613842 RepID=A0A5N0T9R7_9GAMM|nr:sigma-70 family RNA polymerase sigma factor [Marinihelvus fidelis]